MEHHLKKNQDFMERPDEFYIGFMEKAESVKYYAA